MVQSEAVKTRADDSLTFTLLPRGAVLGGLAVVLVIAGLWRVDGVLAALGLAMGCLLALAWILARLNPAGLEIILDGPAKVQAGVISPWVMGVVNRRRWLDAFALRMELRLPGKTRVGGTAAWVSAGSAADLELRVSIPERAWADTQEARLISDFPFGFFQVERVFALAHALCVTPRPVMPRGLAFSGGRMDEADAVVATAGETPGEIRGLRPWRAGDSPRRILWPASLRSMARGAGMVVIECDPPGFRPMKCAVVFHSFGPDGGLIRPERFEKALSLAAGTLRHLQSQGVAARWIADFNDWKPLASGTRMQLAACMENMARAARAGSTEAHDLQAALREIREDEGLIVISDMPVAAWRAAMPERRHPAILTEIPGPKHRMEVAR